MIRPAAPRGRAVTLLEVLISIAILAGMALVLAYAILPLNRASAVSRVGLDQDRDARRFLAELRRELRQGGYRSDTGDDMTQTPASGATIAVTSSATGQTVGDRTSLLAYQRRNGLDDTAWSAVIHYDAVYEGTYSGVPTTINEYRIERWEDANGNSTLDTGEGHTVLKRVTNFSVSRPSGDTSLLFEFELCEPYPVWTGSTAPAPIRRSYKDQVDQLNKLP